MNYYGKSVNKSGIFCKSCAVEAVLRIRPLKIYPKHPKVVTLEVNRIPAENVNTNKLLPVIYATIDFI